MNICNLTKRLHAIALVGVFAIPPPAHAATTADGDSVPVSATVLTGPAIAGDAIFSASSKFKENCGPETAFDNQSSATRLLHDGKTFSILYTFETKKIVNGYGFKMGGDHFKAARAPKSWVIYGSDTCNSDGSNDSPEIWTKLDERTGQTGWKDGEYRYYAFRNTSSYKTYKLEITGTNNTSDNWTQWKYLEFVRDILHQLEIACTPVAIPRVTPAVGEYEMPTGTTTFVSEPSAETEDTKAVCTGWKVYVRNTADEWVEDAERGGTGTSFTWDAMPTEDTKIVWQYDATYLLTREATAEGTCRADAEWFAHRSNATVTAVPADGHQFHCWIGDVPESDAIRNPLVLTMDGPKTVKPVFLPVEADGLTLFVALDGDDANNGFSDANALRTLKAAVTKLKETYPGLPAVIRVGSGTFTQGSPHVLDGPIRVIGSGRDEGGTELQVTSGWDKSNTDARVFRLLHAGAGVFNLAMEKGYSGLNDSPNGGGAVYMTDGIVSNCVIRNCMARQTSSTVPLGGGVYLNGAGALLTHCIVSNCTAKFDANWGSYATAGIHVFDGRVRETLVRDCRTHSSAPAHEKIVGGIYVSGNGSAVNCSVIDCQGSFRGGFYMTGKAVVTNCVAFGCRKYVKVDGEMTSTVNCFGHDGKTASPANYVNCAFEEGEPCNDTCIAGVVPAAFADYANGNYTPNFGDVLFDAGLARGDAPETDLSGGARLDGNAIDIGALEGSSAANLQIVGIPSNYGVSGLGWGNRADLSGEVAATVNEVWFNEDNSLKAVCTGWKLYESRDGEWSLVDEGEEASATFTVPQGQAKLEWHFTKYHRITVTTAGEGTASAPEWVVEGTTFVPAAVAADGWKFLGWIDYLDRIADDPTPGEEPVFESTSYRALFLPQGCDCAVQYADAARGNDGNDGLTWETAKASVTNAIAAVARYGKFGGIVHAAPGHYLFSKEAPVVIDTPIRVFGHTSTGLPGEVLFSGAEGSYVRAFELNDPGALVSTFVISNGLAAAGGQVYLAGKGGTLTNCIVRNCRTHNAAHGARGAILANGSHSLVTHTVVCESSVGEESPHSGRKACGIHLTGGARAENCLVANCHPEVETPNEALSIGGIYVGEKCAAVNCTVVGCTGHLAGGIFAENGHVTNCVAIACSYATETPFDGAAARTDLAGTTNNFVNCAGGMPAKVNEIHDCQAGLTPESAFRDAANGDYAPKSGGPLVNRGAPIPEWANALDLAGRTRVFGRTIDIGCRESNQAGYSIIIR